MLSSDVRLAIGRAVAAAGLEPADPGLRPTGTPGQYASNVAFALGEPARPVAARLAASLAQAEHVMHAEVTGPGFVTVTVSPQAFAHLPERISTAGPACATSDALRGRTVPALSAADPLAAPGWDEAATALAARLTARLAAAAGATVAPYEDSERTGLTPDADQFAVQGGDRVRSAAGRSGPVATGQRRPETDVAAAVAFAGADAVLFSLARAVPGRPPVIDRLAIARHLTDNPAYAVRYAHARAVSGVRWAAISRETEYRRGPAGPISLPSTGPAAPRTGRYGGQGGWGAGAPQAEGPLPREIAVLIDALSWLPERVAAAARRGRPDEFARYLEELASATIDALIVAGGPGSKRGPGADRLGLAGAARTGLAAGLGLLGISAPDRL